MWKTRWFPLSKTPPYKTPSAFSCAWHTTLDCNCNCAPAVHTNTRRKEDGNAGRHCIGATPAARTRALSSLQTSLRYPALYEADNSLLIFDKRPASCINRAFIATKPEDDKFGSYQQNKGIMDNINKKAKTLTSYS